MDLSSCILAVPTGVTSSSAYTATTGVTNVKSIIARINNVLVLNMASALPP